MTWAAPSNDSWAGVARLATPDAKATFLSEARAACLLWVELEAPRPAVRGRLSLFIEGAIERALDARGAPPPAPPFVANREAIVTDQLRRAVVSGTSGIALWLSSLEGITGPERAFDSSDSTTLRWWLDATAERPVRLAFDDANRRLGVYLEPRTLESLLAEAATQDDDPDPDASGDPDDDAVRPERAEASPEAEDAAPSEPVSLARDVAEHAPSPPHDGVDAAEALPQMNANAVNRVGAPSPDFAESARAMAEQIADDSDTGWLRHALIELSTPVPLAVDEAAPRDPAPPPGGAISSGAAGNALDLLRHTAEPAVAAPAAAEEVAAPVTVGMDAPEAAVQEPVAAILDAPAPRLELHLAESPEVPAPAAHVEEKRKLEACWRELMAATGPKPLAVVERLFTTAYMPLRAALDRGADMPALRETADDWSQSFEKSYLDGFDALRVRTKRPAMVVDVPDMALRVARLHGARSTQLLLVDALRFDLGEMVNDRIRALVGQRAACAERFLLWAALPTTTATQIELIGRGPAGLREPISGTSEELVVGKGRKAQMIRRLKTGHRELLKLDIVAARLSEPHGEDPSGFDAIADEVAQRIAAHFEGLQPRTLVVIFGDHGFSVENHAEGRKRLSEGGASPEEVLVPAFAWLVGAVH